MKVKVSVNIDKEVYEKSHKLGVNVSQACTNYLKTLNRQIETTLSQTEGFLGKASFTKEGLAGGEGFEPSTPNLGGWCSIRTELLAHSVHAEPQSETCRPYFIKGGVFASNRSHLNTG
jgi:post-segregation antitoxin (ccd killing protein)